MQLLAINRIYPEVAHPNMGNNLCAKCVCVHLLISSIDM
jgi:hypothetical protein